MLRLTVFCYVVMLTITACVPKSNHEVIKPKDSPSANLESLMDEKLATRVQAEIKDIVGSYRVISSTKFSKYVASPPTEAIGSRKWSELWIFNAVAPDGKLVISIQERGLNLADVEIQAYNGELRKFQFDNRD